MDKILQWLTVLIGLYAIAGADVSLGGESRGVVNSCLLNDPCTASGVENNCHCKYNTGSYRL